MKTDEGVKHAIATLQRYGCDVRYVKGIVYIRAVDNVCWSVSTPDELDAYVMGWIAAIGRARSLLTTLTESE